MKTLETKIQDAISTGSPCTVDTCGWCGASDTLDEINTILWGNGSDDPFAKIAKLEAELKRFQRYLYKIAELHRDEYCDMGPKMDCLVSAAFRTPIPEGYECFVDEELVAEIEGG